MTKFNNPTIANMDLNAVAAHVQSNQSNIAATANTYRQRSRKDNANLMLEARTFIKQMRESVSLDKQAEILTRHQINAAGKGVSEYTPWIKLLFGKHDADSKTVKFGGREHVKWKPDTSYARYFNFFEVIDRDFTGQEDQLLKWILEQGGPAPIVEKELKRKREATQPSKETVQKQRNLYLTEVNAPFVNLDPTAIEGKHDFVGVILRRTELGFRFIGVNKPDADADFERLAAKNFDALSKVVEAREIAEETARKEAEAEQRGKDRATGEIAAKMGMTVEEMRERMGEIQKRHSDKASQSTDQQNAA